MSATTNYEAIGILHAGGPTTSIELPIPNEIGPHDVQVKVAFAAVAHVDTKQAETGIYISKWPFIPGKEFSGTVSRVGKDVSDLSAGDRVIGVAYVDGSFQEYLTVPRAHIAPIPASYELNTACTIPHTFTSGFVSLFHKAGLHLPLSPSPEERNAPILIWGASTASGTYAIQSLRNIGYTSIIAVASSSHFERLKRLGASAVFDRSQKDLVDVIKKTSDNIRLALVCQADANGWTNVLSSLSSKGAHVAYIIGLSPKSVPEGIKLSRTTGFMILGDSEFGDTVVSRYLANWLQQQSIDVAKAISLVDVPEFRERVERGFLLERNGEAKGIVIRVV